MLSFVRDWLPLGLIAALLTFSWVGHLYFIAPGAVMAKRRRYRQYVSICILGFALIPVASGYPIAGLVLLVPAALTGLMLVHQTRFCDKCSGMAPAQGLLGAASVCSVCRAPLVAS